MSDPPRPKRLQFHLSTAIVMMLVAAIFVWLNTIPAQGPGMITLDSEEAATMSGLGLLRSSLYGWPRHFVHTYSFPVESEYNNVQMYYDALAIDATIAIAAVIISYVLCEYLIRRRALR